MDTPDSLPEQPGLHDLRVTLPDGTVVAATLSLPAAPRGAALVLVLHYGGTPHGYYGRPLLSQLVEPAWRSLGAVFVAPVSAGGDWESAANTHAVLGLMAHLEDHYRTDRRRRVVVGYSLGAIGCWHLCQQAPGYFSAAVPIAGRVPSAVDTALPPTSVLHSQADQLFPCEAVDANIAALVAQGQPARLATLTGVDHFAFGAFHAPLNEQCGWLHETWNATR